jgi:uncharacterized protein YndB with AHSA1/START domain
MPNTKLTQLNFTITINASVETVWHKMLNLETYKIWTAQFEPSSYYEGGWEQGDVIKFMSRDNSGMVGFIKENRPLEYISIEYTGELKDGNIDLESPATEVIKGSHENYTFNKISETQTQLIVQADTSQEWSEYLNAAWPKALNKLKEICEV